MEFTQFEIISTVSLTLTGIWFVYKRIPKIKVQIKPVPDNFFCSSLAEIEESKRGTHQMEVEVYNHGYSPRTIINGELEIKTEAQTYSVAFFDQKLKKLVGRNENLSKTFNLSELELPNNVELQLILTDSKNKRYKSNRLNISMFNPSLNPLE